MAITNEINSSDKIKSGKKRGRSAKKMMTLASDPPILVGGGGSTLIWVRNEFCLTPIALSDVPAGAPHPGHPNNYRVYEVNVEVTASTVKINQGGGQSKFSGMDPKKHSTEFEV